MTPFTHPFYLYSLLLVPSTEQDALLAKRKEVFKLPLLFLWENTLQSDLSCRLELGGREGGSCCSGSLCGLRLGRGMKQQWEVHQHLMCSQHCSRSGSSEAAAATGRGWCGRRESWLLFQAGTLQSVCDTKKKKAKWPLTLPLFIWI